MLVAGAHNDVGHGLGQLADAQPQLHALILIAPEDALLPALLDLLLLEVLPAEEVARLAQLGLRVRLRAGAGFVGLPLLVPGAGVRGSALLGLLPDLVFDVSKRRVVDLAADRDLAGAFDGLVDDQQLLREVALVDEGDELG